MANWHPRWWYDRNAEFQTGSKSSKVNDFKTGFIKTNLVAVKTDSNPISWPQALN